LVNAHPKGTEGPDGDRGDGVGHLGTRHIDSRLKDNSQRSGDGDQEEVRIGGMYEDDNSHLHGKRGDDIEDESEIEEERIEHISKFRKKW
jgi:hypothetical protein